MKRTILIALGLVLVCIAILALWLIPTENHRRAADARTQVCRWAEQLHAQTNDAGIYIRHPANRLPENDPWGSPLVVTYAQGGFAETLTVRSAGPDRTFHTQDDIVEHRSVVNLKGIGKGAKDNVEEFAQKGARGLTKGAVEGIKEAVLEKLAGNKPGEQKGK
jgi:hypothetical protein